MRRRSWSIGTAEPLTIHPFQGARGHCALLLAMRL
jgi:hypothetical protein